MTTPASSLDSAIKTLRAHRLSARSEGVELIGIVGSFARGEARSDSDIDVYAEFLRGTTLFKIGRVACALEDALGRPVDLVDSKMLRPGMKESMERDLIRA